MSEAMVTEAIILAGGMGTRLAAAVPDVPKPLAPVAGRPFLAWLLEALEDSGLTRIVFATGYRAAMIRDCFGARHGTLDILYSEEATPLGTGGALFQALGHCSGERVFAMNGDTFQQLDLPAMAAADPQADITVAVRPVPDRSRFGAVEVVQGRVRRFGQKGMPGPGPVNAGTYLLRRDLPGRLGLPAAFSFEADVLETMTERLHIAAHIAEGPFLDIGVPEDWIAASTLLPEWAKS